MIYMTPGDWGRPLDYRLSIEGNRLVGRDVYAGGELGLMKTNLGEYASPLHALAWFLLWERTDFLILCSLGKITDEVIEKMVTGLRDRPELTEKLMVAARSG